MQPKRKSLSHSTIICVVKSEMINQPVRVKLSYFYLPKVNALRRLKIVSRKF